jgi:hypothetical protein
VKLSEAIEVQLHIATRKTKTEQKKTKQDGSECRRRENKYNRDGTENGRSSSTNTASPTQEHPAASHHHHHLSLLRRSSNSKPAASGAGSGVKHPNPAARACDSTPQQPASAAPSWQLQQRVQPDGSNRPDRSHLHRHACAPARAAEAKARAPLPRLNPSRLDPLPLAARALPAMAVRRPMATPPYSREVHPS